MSKMMDELHKIREKHHERVGHLPLGERARCFPRTCEKCGHQLVSVAQPAGSPVGETYALVRIVKLEDGEATVKVKAPPCPNCSHEMVFDFEC